MAHSIAEGVVVASTVGLSADVGDLKVTSQYNHYIIYFY